VVSVIRVLICCLAIAAVARPASADWHFTPFAGFTFRGGTTIADFEEGAGRMHVNVGGAATIVGDGPIGVEALFVYTPGFFDRGELIDVTTSRSVALMGNVVLTVPLAVWNRDTLRPFFSGGAGLLHGSQTLRGDVLEVKHNIAAYNLGGGAVGFLSDRTGMRFDLRYFRNLRPGEPSGSSVDRVRLHYWTATVGVVFRLGSPGGPSGRAPR
jgi:hypothetical protein